MTAAADESSAGMLTRQTLDYVAWQQLDHHHQQQQQHCYATTTSRLTSDDNNNDNNNDNTENYTGAYIRSALGYEETAWCDAFWH